MDGELWIFFETSFFARKASARRTRSAAIDASAKGIRRLFVFIISLLAFDESFTRFSPIRKQIQKKQKKL